MIPLPKSDILSPSHPAALLIPSHKPSTSCFPASHNLSGSDEMPSTTVSTRSFAASFPFLMRFSPHSATSSTASLRKSEILPGSSLKKSTIALMKSDAASPALSIRSENHSLISSAICSIHSETPSLMSENHAPTSSITSPKKS